MQETESQSGAAEQRGEETPDLGARLRSERNRQNLSLEQIAEELRLEPRVLHALEDERFEDLVAPVFARGYLRQYGRKLGLDCDGLLRDYDRLTQLTEVELEPPQSATVRAMQVRLNRRWMFAALVVIFFAAVGAGVVWWFGGVGGLAERFGLVSNSANPAALPYPTLSVAEAESEEESVRTDARLTRPGGAAGREPVVPSLAQFILGNPVDPGDPADLADLTDPVDPVDPVDPGAPAVPGAGDDPAAAADLVSTVDDLAGYATVEATLIFVQDSWAEVTDARGVSLMYELAARGVQRTVVGAAPVDFLFGNAAGVSLAIDGETYVIPRSDSPGTVVGFTVEASGD